MKELFRRLIRLAGYEVINIHRPAQGGQFPVDFDRDTIATYLGVRSYTMTSPERVFALIRAVEYILANGIPGSFVECGVWRGGSMMAVARTLIKANRTNIDLVLFDTFRGMARPGDNDPDFAKKHWEKGRCATYNSWCYAPLDEVKANMRSTGYPVDHVHYIEGKVEETLPGSSPEAIALLRLDTDFYESTKHELVHLFPRLTRGGVLIVDDYGSFEGSRKAVDEYIHESNLCLLLNRVDSDSRIGVKL